MKPDKVLTSGDSPSADRTPLKSNHSLDELPARWADALVTTQSIRIGFLDEADAHELIVRPVKDVPEIYEPEAIDHILALTRSRPYLMQLL